MPPCGPRTGRARNSVRQEPSACFRCSIYAGTPAAFNLVTQFCAAVSLSKVPIWTTKRLPGRRRRRGRFRCCVRGCRGLAGVFGGLRRRCRCRRLSASLGLRLMASALGRRCGFQPAFRGGLRPSRFPLWLRAGFWLPAVASCHCRRCRLSGCRQPDHPAPRRLVYPPTNRLRRHLSRRCERSWAGARRALGISMEMSSVTGFGCESSTMRQD